MFLFDISNYHQLLNDDINLLRDETRNNASIITTLTNEIECLKTSQGSRLGQMHMEFNELSNNFLALQDKFKSMETKVQKHVNTGDKNTTAHIDDKFDHIDRFMLSKNLVIINVPVRQNEDVSAITLKLAHSVGMNNLMQTDFIGYKILPNKNTSSHPPLIIIKFYNKRNRDELFQHYINQVKEKKFPCLASLGITDTNARIFLNEHLTSRAFKIFMAARKLKQENSQIFHQVHTYQGNIYVRLTEHGKRVKINSVDHLSTFFPNKKKTTASTSK